MHDRAFSRPPHGLIMPISVLAFLFAVSLPATIAAAATATLPTAPQSTVNLDPSPAAKAENQQVIALEFTQARDVVKHLNRMIKQPRGTAGFIAIPHPGSNSVLLRGTAKLITDAKDLIARADVQPAFRKEGSTTQFVIIEHGKSKDIASTLNRFLQTSLSNDLRIASYAPNNMVLLRGTKSRITESLNLIAQLDRKPTKQLAAPRIVYLEHTRATELAATLNRFLELDIENEPNRGFIIDANNSNNAVILRGTAQQVSEVLDLIARLDIKTPSTKGHATRVVVLKHVQAKDLTSTLKRFTGPKSAYNIDVRYSEKTNTILLEGREDQMQQILKLIEKLDKTSVDGKAKTDAKKAK
jgi:type II secretory pathway component GspD/PulD (secretin)